MPAENRPASLQRPSGLVVQPSIGCSLGNLGKTQACRLLGHPCAAVPDYDAPSTEPKRIFKTLAGVSRCGSGCELADSLGCEVEEFGGVADGYARFGE
jgi:hypothetical protein